MRGNGEGKPVVALDVDGTLGDYHRHFLWFAEQYLDKPMPDAQTINPGERLHKFMHVRLADYRAAKLAFRQGGFKRWMPAYPYASELTTSVRRAGAEVWICTTRPYLRLDNIDPDTREWLRRNNIKYDAVLFGEDKYKELKRQAGGRVAAILDDLPEMYYEANRLFPTWTGYIEETGEPIPLKPGPAIILRDQPYNQHVTPLRRALTLEDAWEHIRHGLASWKAVQRTSGVDLRRQRP
jgi:hypothetical protein